MSTSADPRSAVPLELRPARLDDPAVAALVGEVQAEYVVRYGGPDATPLDAAQFEPPTGMFLLGRVAGRPVACGGWRPHGDGTAEVKRMFVTARWRRRGLASQLLAELEATAFAAGRARIVLETGRAQPEAIALYERSGYRPVPAFGYYADAPLAVHLGKTLGDGAALKTALRAGDGFTRG